MNSTPACDAFLVGPRSGAALGRGTIMLRAEIAAANQAVADNHDFREAGTRDLFIDLLLRQAGSKAPDTI